MIISSIDIGTNTVLLLIAKYDPESKSLTPVRSEIRMPRIGKGLVKGGNISNEKINSLLQVLVDYQKVISDYNTELILPIATNAFRIASNANEIKSLVYNNYGWDIEIISGELEAELAYLGVSSTFNESRNNLVTDIGGGSTELIVGTGDKINFKKSFPIGVVIATERYFLNSPPATAQLENFDMEIEKIFLDNIFNAKIETATAIAGTPTTLACMIKQLKDFDEDQVEGSIITVSDLNQITNSLSKLSDKQILANYGNVVQGREDLILAGAKILTAILKKLNLKSVTVSSKGIRHGILMKYIKSAYF